MSDITPQELLMAPINSREELQAWLKDNLGFTLPDCKVTEYADSTPLDFVYDVYRHIMDGKPLHTMALSGRDSGKTVALSIIDLLSLLHDQRSAIHMGMTKDQAKRAREYLDNYIKKHPIIKGTVTKDNTTELKLKVDNDEVGLELIAMSPKAVQGAHYALVSYDEVSSSVDPTHLKAYKDSSGIPGSSRKGKPAVIVKITSRQAGYSLAEQEIKNAAKSGIKIVKWTTIDCMKKCPDERSGTEYAPMWVNIIKGKHHTDTEFAQLSEKEKDGYSRTTDTKKNCHTCPLAVYCQGKAKKQTSTSPLLREIDDVITKVNSSGSHDWIVSQIMSLSPSTEGLVYFEFTRSLHIPGWNAMWETLTGQAPPIEITRDEFLKQLKRSGATFYAGIDFGWSSPSTCVVIAVDRRDNVYVVDAVGKTFISDPEWVEFVKTNIHSKYDVQMYCPDAEDQGAIKHFRDNNIPCANIDKSKGTVKAGVNTVKRFLRIPGTNNQAKIFIAPDIGSTVTNVPGLVDEFELYKKQTDVTGKILDDQNPEKGNDHYLDALRYVLFWLFGKIQMQATFATSGYEPVLVTNAPTADELARMQGVTFNDNRGDFKNMGVQDDDDPDDDPDGNGSPGGGLKVAWT